MNKELIQVGTLCDLQATFDAVQANIEEHIQNFNLIAYDKFGILGATKNNAITDGSLAYTLSGNMTYYLVSGIAAYTTYGSNAIVSSGGNDSNFESTIGNWVSYIGGATARTTPGYLSVGCLQWTPGGAGQGSKLNVGTQLSYTKTYRITMMLNDSSIADTLTYGMLYNSVETDTHSTGGISAWKQVQFETTVPAAGTVEIFVKSGLGVALTFNIDNVTAELRTDFPDTRVYRPLWTLKIAPGKGMGYKYKTKVVNTLTYTISGLDSITPPAINPAELYLRPTYYNLTELITGFQYGAHTAFVPTRQTGTVYYRAPVNSSPFLSEGVLVGSGLNLNNILRLASEAFNESLAATIDVIGAQPNYTICKLSSDFDSPTTLTLQGTVKLVPDVASPTTSGLTISGNLASNVSITADGLVETVNDRHQHLDQSKFYRVIWNSASDTSLYTPPDSGAVSGYMWQFAYVPDINDSKLQFTAIFTSGVTTSYLYLNVLQFGTGQLLAGYPAASKLISWTPNADGSITCTVTLDVSNKTLFVPGTPYIIGAGINFPTGSTGNTMRKYGVALVSRFSVVKPQS